MTRISDGPPGRASNVRLDPKGYWVAEEAEDVSYPEQGHGLCFEVEDESFWFRHRNAVIVEVLRRFPPSGPVFDVGGGNGYVSSGLERAGFATVLVEPGRIGAENARRRGVSNVICATVESAGFEPRSLDAIGLFDVVEHIEDDAAFLASLQRLMAPGGRIYLTVPAFQGLWSSEDEFAGHHRRYTKKTLARVLRGAGFEIEYLTYLFWFLPLPVLMFRTIPSWFGARHEPSLQSARREHAGGKGPIDRLVGRSLAWELAKVARGKSLPIGGSCLAVARCRESSA